MAEKRRPNRDIENALKGVKRDVDMLIISIGGNGVGFSSWVEKATIHDLKEIAWLSDFAEVNPDILPEVQLRNSLDAVSYKYENLYVALKNTRINFKKTIFTGYPN